MEEWGIFVCVFTLLFIVSLGTFIIAFFEHKLLWDNKKFKGVCLDAEIIYFDTVQLDKWSYDITIINYKLNEKSKDAILLKKETDKIGDIIKIADCGEVSYRIKRDWRDIFNKRQCITMSLCCLSGLIFFTNLTSINIYYLFGCIIYEMISILRIPKSRESFYKHMKRELGWHIN